MRRFADSDTTEQIKHAMRESVLPADDVPGRPPGAHVLVRPIGYQHIAEALDLGRVVVEEHIQLVHPVEVEDNAALAAVDLERVEVRAALGEARSLEAADRAVLE